MKKLLSVKAALVSMVVALAALLFYLPFSGAVAGPLWQIVPTPSPMPSAVTSEIVALTLESLTVPVGTTVTWVNRDSVAHTTTAGTPPNNLSGEWDSGPLSNGQSFSVTLTEPGTFPYFCRIHPRMTASVTVTG